MRFPAAILVLSVFLWATSALVGQSSGASLDAKPIRAYHDRSIRDLDAIGNRNVGCGRGLGNWYSIEGQIQMGKAYSQQVEQSSKVVKDPVITEYINRIGQNLVRNSDSQVPFTIKVLDSDSVNAFALPGGFFYVNSGLILAADNEAELAGVMAHEIAHVAACHVARQNTRGQLMSLASIPLIFVGGGIGYAAQNLAGLAMPMTFLKFTRGFESQADFRSTWRSNTSICATIRRPLLHSSKKFRRWKRKNPGRWRKPLTRTRKRPTAWLNPSRRSQPCCRLSRSTSLILPSFKT